MAIAPTLAVMEEHRAEGLASRIGQILVDPQNPSQKSLSAYRLAARLAFETAAANTDQPAILTACDWCGQGDHDPIDPQDGE